MLIRLCAISSEGEVNDSDKGCSSVTPCAHKHKLGSAPISEKQDRNAQDGGGGSAVHETSEKALQGWLIAWSPRIDGMKQLALLWSTLHNTQCRCCVFLQGPARHTMTSRYCTRT
jgi:hypothetical protein